MVGSAAGAHNTSSLQLLPRHLHFVLFHWVFKMIKELWVWPWCQVSCHSWNRDLQGLPPNLRNDILGFFWGQGRWRERGHIPHTIRASCRDPPHTPRRPHPPEATLFSSQAALWQACGGHLVTVLWPCPCHSVPPVILVPGSLPQGPWIPKAVLAWPAVALTRSCSWKYLAKVGSGPW